MKQSKHSIIDSLFRRNPKADYLEGASPWRVGLSMAATWSWGAAVAVGISVLHTLGLAPFIVWVFFNCLSIGLFGFYYTYIENVQKWKSLLPLLLMWAFVGLFAIIMNMNTILAVLAGNMDIPAQGIMSPTAALYTTIGIGLVIAWFIGVMGLRGSVLTDVGQLSLQFIGVFGILVVGLVQGHRAEWVWMEGSQLSWMIGAALGFIFGATASGMQWQRIEILPSKQEKWHATLWGSGIFTVFMLFVVPAAFVYVGNLWQSLFLIVAALAVATSTADSGSALLQYTSQRLSLPAIGGTLLTLTGVLTFHLFADMGLTGIWTFYANVRWMVILTLLICTIAYNIIGGVPDTVKNVAKQNHLVIPDAIFTGEESRNRNNENYDLSTND